MVKIDKAKKETFEDFLDDSGVSQEKLKRVLQLLTGSFCFSGEETCPYSVGDEFEVCDLQNDDSFDRTQCPVVQFADFVGGGEIAYV